MKVVSVVGARPQYIKVAAVSRRLRLQHEEILIDTGQHYDFEMSDIFIRQLEIPRPDFDLGVGSGSHASQTASILVGVEKVLGDVAPERVIVYGDTNSTLAASLAAVKLGYPVAHVEAGERSYDRSMPEEINRVVADHVSDLLFCSTATAMENLKREGIREGVHLVGDVMYDSLSVNLPKAKDASSILTDLELEEGAYILVTLHRPGNVDDLSRLRGLISALGSLGETVLFPVHPRTRYSLSGLEEEPPLNVKMVSPLSYLDMLAAEMNARLVITDSGGVQKEAYLLGVPCITCREETEWVETVQAGWNTLVGSDSERLLTAVNAPFPRSERPSLFGDGRAAERIVEILT